MNGSAQFSASELGAALAAVTGTALSLVGTGLYLRDIRRGHTRPHRGSWLVWGVISVLAALSHGAEGGGWSLVVLCGQAVATLLVLACAMRCGAGRLTIENLVMLGLATCGVVGWLMLTDPMAGTACAVVADGAGLVAMAPKAWADPNSETLATYALAGVTGLFGALAVEAWDASLLLFPIYFCLGNTVTAVMIALRRHALTVTERTARTRPRAELGMPGLALRQLVPAAPAPRHCSNPPFA
jgi:hypothetical protein